MRSTIALLVLAVTVPLAAQEREVPRDSARISIPGCAKDRRFIVAERLKGEPVRSDIRPGRRAIHRAQG
jgi:hypothetical protein